MHVLKHHHDRALVSVILLSNSRDKRVDDDGIIFGRSELLMQLPPDWFIGKLIA